MIIVHTAGGRTGNQILLLAHLMATTLEHQRSFINVCFQSKKFFNVVSQRGMRNFYSRPMVWILWRCYFLKFLRPFFRLIGIEFLTNTRCLPENALDTLTKIPAKKLTILNVWPYTDYAALYLHQAEIRKRIRPRQRFLNDAQRIINNLRALSDIVVGIHVRRTDYQQWCHGAYFYNMSVYANYMKQILSFCNKKIFFVICSDEKLNPADFANVSENIYFSNNHFMTDLALLAQCDYILGPPSTFGSFASFYGQVPRYTLYTPNEKITSFDYFGISLIDYDDTYECYQNDSCISRLHISLNKGGIISTEYKAIQNNETNCNSL